MESGHHPGPRTRFGHPDQDALPPVTELLGRPEMEIDISASAQFVSGRRVLVTGAGGSIGSQLCQALLSLAPAELIMLDHDDSALEAVRLAMPPDHARAARLVLADIRDVGRIERVVRAGGPDVVFHAAALKHVPLLQHHPEEALLTNVFGTHNVLRAAALNRVPLVVNLSTDKAADPISALGHTKYIAERLVAWYAEQGRETRYVSVRLGNVLASRGSVLEVFAVQAATGQPLTLTDERATRYFITPAEAVGMLLTACAVGRSGDTLLHNRGVPVRISDTVRRFITHHGGDIDLRQTGLRPGEKLHEVMSGVHERIEEPDGSPLSRVRVAPLEPTAVRSAYQSTEGAVTVGWLLRFVRTTGAAVARHAPPASGGDPGHGHPTQDRFGFPMAWAIDFRRSMHRFDRTVARWRPEQAASVRAATLLCDGEDRAALDVLRAGPGESFRDLFNAGVAYERLGDHRAAGRSLDAARRLRPDTFAALRAQPELRRATLVLPFPVTSGGMRVQVKVARTLMEIGFRVTVCQLRGDPTWIPDAQDFERVVAVDSHAELAGELGRFPDSLTLVGCWVDYLPALAAARGPVVGYSGGEPTLNESDGFDDAFLSYRHEAHRLPVRLLTCSRFIQRTYRENFGRPSSYVPAALDERAFLPGPEKARRPLRVLLVARDGIKDKGLGFAVPALVNLQRRGLDIEIVWVTQQPPEVFVDLPCELHVDPPKDLLYDIFRSCHALVYPPLVDGLGLPPMEAMAAGVAVVVTASGGSGEFIQDGLNCLVVEKGSVPAIENAVERLYVEPALLARLAEGGRRTAATYRPDNAAGLLRRWVDTLNSPVCTELP
ncbi:polysaccharide biosynthesis protein [Polymorphospora lycopeni]|uniref:Polysaccharide biosynthesis protein n=1 Tax=Polymorphospora lycopeni TaxID=3140240 RepID=A0ABV5CQQ7_9ACTN